jgi:hypothetical protein
LELLYHGVAPGHGFVFANQGIFGRAANRPRASRVERELLRFVVKRCDEMEFAAQI